jgi:hypothetical protein
MSNYFQELFFINYNNNNNNTDFLQLFIFFYTTFCLLHIYFRKKYTVFIIALFIFINLYYVRSNFNNWFVEYTEKIFLQDLYKIDPVNNNSNNTIKYFFEQCAPIFQSSHVNKNKYIFLRDFTREFKWQCLSNNIYYDIYQTRIVELISALVISFLYYVISLRLIFSKYSIYQKYNTSKWKLINNNGEIKLTNNVALDYQISLSKLSNLSILPINNQLIYMIYQSSGPFLLDIIFLIILFLMISKINHFELINDDFYNQVSNHRYYKYIIGILFLNIIQPTIATIKIKTLEYNLFELIKNSKQEDLESEEIKIEINIHKDNNIKNSKTSTNFFINIIRLIINIYKKIVIIVISSSLFILIENTIERFKETKLYNFLYSNLFIYFSSFNNQINDKKNFQNMSQFMLNEEEQNQLIESIKKFLIYWYLVSITIYLLSISLQSYVNSQIIILFSVLLLPIIYSITEVIFLLSFLQKTKIKKISMEF